MNKKKDNNNKTQNSNPNDTLASLESSDKYIEEMETNQAVRTDRKHGVVHKIFVIAIWAAFIVYLSFVGAWVLHKLKIYRWLEPAEVASIEDLVLFIFISLLVTKIQSPYNKRNLK